MIDFNSILDKHGTLVQVGDWVRIHIDYELSFMPKTPDFVGQVEKIDHETTITTVRVNGDRGPIAADFIEKITEEEAMLWIMSN